MDRVIVKSLYFNMLRIRKVEERIAELYPEQEMRCPVHLCIGQEAIPVGVCTNLSRHDYVLSNHRSHGHYLAKGGNLKAMMGELYGKKTGCAQGKGGSMHLVDLTAGFLGATPIVGSTIPIATGVAFGHTLRGKQNVTVVFFGDAAVEEGVFHESVNFAVLKKLPVVFVCENNLYSVNSPLSVRQPKKQRIFELVRGHGIKSYQGDGNDVIEIYNLSKRAVKMAKNKRGPTFLEFKTYRWREHCGPDFDHQSGIRPENEFEKWKRSCPIKRFRSLLLKKKLLSERAMADMSCRIEKEIAEAVLFAKESPFPEGRMLFEHLFAR